MDVSQPDLLSFHKIPRLLGLVAFSFIFGTIAVGIYRLYFHPLSKYPGPKYAAISELPLSYATIQGDIHNWVKRIHDQYGEVVRVAPGKLSFISPQAWKDIHGHRVGAAKDKSITKDPLFYQPEFNGEYQLGTVIDDVEHGRLRKIFSNAFSDKALRKQEHLISDFADMMIANLKKTTTATDMVKNFNCTTFDIMGELAFGESLGLLKDSEYSPWVRAIFGGMKAVALISTLLKYSSLALWFIPKSLVEKQKIHFGNSAERVDRRMEQGLTQKPDFWNLVLDKGGQLTRAQMHSHSAFFMLAGTETTATLLSGLTYYLLKNPDKLKKVTDEVRALDADDLHLDTLQRLEYLNACFEEALRCYPPVPIGLARIVGAGGSDICGEWVPAGTQVYVSQWAAYRSSLNFKDPNSFVPERWLPDTGYDSDRKDALQPFSIGPRACIGKNLAYHEMRIIFAKLVWNFDLQLAPESEGWADQKVWNLWDKPPLMATVKPVQAMT